MPTQDEIDALMRQMRGTASAAPPIGALPVPSPTGEAESPGMFFRVLDYLNRPNAAIMGALSAPWSRPWEAPVRMYEGFTGKKPYSGSDVIHKFYEPGKAINRALYGNEYGLTPEVNKAVADAWEKWGGLAFDILNPLDPLNYVTLGLNKAGRVASAAGKTLDVASEAGKLPGKVLKRNVIGIDRVKAAEEGLWSPINFMGTSVLPKSASVATAKVVQPTLNAISQSAPAQYARGLVGGANALIDPVIKSAFEKADVARRQALSKGSEVLKGIKGATTPEQRRFMTLEVEDPEMAAKLRAGEDVTVHVPTQLTPEALERRSEIVKAQGEAAVKVSRAYNAVARQELKSLSQAIDGWQAGKQELINPHEAAYQIGMQSGGDLLKQLYAGGQKRKAALDLLGFDSFDGIVHQNGDTLLAVTSSGKKYLAPDIANLGGIRKPIEERKAIVKQALDGLQQYVTEGGDLLDVTGTKRFLKKQYGLNDPVIDQIREAIDTRMHVASGRGVYTRADAQTIDWMRKMEEYADWKAKQATLDLPNTDPVQKAAELFRMNREWLTKETLETEDRLKRLLVTNEPDVGDLTPLLNGDEVATTKLMRSRMEFLDHMETRALSGLGSTEIPVKLGEDLADRVMKAAYLTPDEGWWKGMKVYIADVWRTWNRIHPREQMTLDAFKEMLTGLSMKQGFPLSRGDLTEAGMDLAKLRESAVIRPGMNELTQTNFINMSNQLDAVVRTRDVKAIRNHIEDVRRYYDPVFQKPRPASPEMTAQLQAQLAAVRAEKAAMQNGQWGVRTIAETNKTLNIGNIYKLEKAAQEIERLDRLRKLASQPDVYEQSVLTLDELKRVSKDAFGVPTQPVLIPGSDAKIVTSKGYNEALEQMRSLLTEANDIFRSRGFKDYLPFGDNYLPHQAPTSMNRLLSLAPKNKLGIQTDKLRSQLTARYISAEIAAGRTPNIDKIAERVDSDIKGLLSDGVYHKGFKAGRGEIPGFKHRTLRFPIYVMNKSDFLKGGFEDDAVIVAWNRLKDAQSWAYGYDVYVDAVKHHGKSLTDLQELYKKEKVQRAGQTIPDGWVPVKYAKPHPDAPSPLDNMYIPDYIEKQIQNRLGGVRAFVGDSNVAHVLEAMNTFREWFSATTLAMFPGFWARNLVGDFVNANLGGWSPATPRGQGAIKGALGATFNGAKKHFDEYVAGLQPLAAGRGDPALLQPDNLRKLMVEKGVVNASLRDDVMEWAQGIASDLDYRDNLGSKLNRYINPLSRQFVGTQFGYRVSQKVANFSRSTLFLDRLTWHLQNAQTPLTQAIEESVQHVNKHLFDYQDLTPFERHIARNLYPFYTWRAKNIPLQLERLVSDPGKMARMARAYHGLWDTEDELQPEDIAPWMRDILGVPIHEYKGPNGEVFYGVASPMGWIPLADLGELAGAFRLNDGGAARFFISALNPVLRESVEQALNQDSYRAQKIDRGQVEDVFGVALPPRVAHVLNNFRFINELDRLNLGNMWTKLGQSLGYYQDTRPNRKESSLQTLRVLRALTGMAIYETEPVNELRTQLKDLTGEANTLMWRAKKSMQRGQTYEAERYRQQAKELVDERRRLSTRMQAAIGYRSQQGETDAGMGP